MAGPTQSTPEAGNKEEPFPASTPDLSTDLLEKDSLDNFELNYDGTSSEDNVGGREEKGSAPQEDSVAGAGSNTPEGTMTLPSPADTTPQDNLNIQHTAIRQMPSQINPPGQTETLPQPESNQKREPITIRNPIQPIRTINPTMSKTKTSVPERQYFHTRAIIRSNPNDIRCGDTSANSMPLLSRFRAH
jgi:hypothetical protein